VVRNYIRRRIFCFAPVAISWLLHSSRGATAGESPIGAVVSFPLTVSMSGVRKGSARSRCGFISKTNKPFAFVSQSFFLDTDGKSKGARIFRPARQRSVRSISWSLALLPSRSYIAPGSHIRHFPSRFLCRHWMQMVEESTLVNSTHFSV
jgi:hypothetical protein